MHNLMRGTKKTTRESLSVAFSLVYAKNVSLLLETLLWIYESENKLSFYYTGDFDEEFFIVKLK